jgi:hypothetical protein
MSEEAKPAPRPAANDEEKRSLVPFLVFIVLFSTMGWYIVSWMSDTTRIQDCVMSGRKNCAPLDPATGR